jgi:hypothetical protein
MRTGFYLRVKRDGRFQSLDIAELSPDEITATMGNIGESRLLSWVISLAQFIKEIRPLYQQVTGPEEHTPEK